MEAIEVMATERRKQDLLAVCHYSMLVLFLICPV
jgi:hypothetical protein